MADILADDAHRRVEELEGALDRARSALRDSEARARLAAADAEANRRLLAEERARTEALLSSSSWRLTAPVRRAVSLLRRLPRGPAQPPDTSLPAPSRPPRLRRPGAPVSFPLAGDVTAHPDLLQAPPAALGEPSGPSVSVVIPTLNAGAEFALLVRKLRAQRGVGAVEIVVVDSGSRDGTPQVAAALGCRVLALAPEAFSHSVSRNLGAEHASGELLLFMVQDAYPVGETWLAGLVQALRGSGEPLAAVSCAEFARADSDLLYDALSLTHYRFLGCAEHDRIGRLTQDDSAALRQQGQLSDVACLIPRALFARYRFQGRYAEDLSLGIRLIRDGHRIAMLSSVRVIHSHRRPAGYYVRRTFVDVVFLADIFADFQRPAATAVTGTLAAHAALFADLPSSFAPPVDAATTPGATADASPAAALDRLIAGLTALALPGMGGALPAGADFGVAALGAWMQAWQAAAAGVGRTLDPDERRAGLQLRDIFAGRLIGLRAHVAACWPVLDATTADELRAAVRTTLAASLGAQLAFAYVDAPDDKRLDELRTLMTAGI